MLLFYFYNMFSILKILTIVKIFLKPVLKSIQDTFYKIASDALLASQQLARILRSSLQSSETNHTECMNYVNDLYKTTLSRLKQTDIDQEVKERAIVCL